MGIEIVTEVYDIAIKQIDNPETGHYDGEWWVTVEDIFFIYDGKKYKISKGYVTNLGSVPKMARSIVSKIGRFLLAYIIHDFMYGDDNGIDHKRKDADKAILVVGNHYGINRKDSLVYRVLRWFGGSSYKKELNRFKDLNTGEIKFYKWSEYNEINVD